MSGFSDIAPDKKIDVHMVSLAGHADALMDILMKFGKKKATVNGINTTITVELKVEEPEKAEPDKPGRDNGKKKSP